MTNIVNKKRVIKVILYFIQISNIISLTGTVTYVLIYSNERLQNQYYQQIITILATLTAFRISSILLLVTTVFEIFYTQKALKFQNNARKILLGIIMVELIWFISKVTVFVLNFDQVNTRLEFSTLFFLALIPVLLRVFYIVMLTRSGYKHLFV